MPIVYAAALPHEPKIIPEVGGEKSAQYEKIRAACETAARRMAEKNVDTIVMISPHSPFYDKYFYFSPEKISKGDLGAFGAKKVGFRVTCDRQTTESLALYAAENRIHIGFHKQFNMNLDYGSIVPLYFIKNYIKYFSIVRISTSGQSFEDHYRMGKCVADVMEGLRERRVAIVASANLSHKLSQDSPLGFAPQGKEFDGRVIKALGECDLGSLVNFREDFCNKVSECAIRPLIILGGALENIKFTPEPLTYEAVNGVGYVVSSFDAEEKKPAPAAADAQNDAFVTVAREALEYYVKTGKKLKAPKNMPAEFKRKAPIFVTLHWKGKIRGCMGTYQPTESTVYEEVMKVTLHAGIKDDLFRAVKPFEIDDITYTVDEILEMERIFDISDLDPNRYGLMVMNAGLRGIILPGSENVNTAEEQLSNALKKIKLDKMRTETKLFRFEVIRHT